LVRAVVVVVVVVVVVGGADVEAVGLVVVGVEPGAAAAFSLSAITAAIERGLMVRRLPAAALGAAPVPEPETEPLFGTCGG
jgi:hypothetical protein